MNMTYEVYSIRDVKVGFGQLMLEQNVSTAIRNFSYAVSSGIMHFGRTDYELYMIGSYDLSSGTFIPLPQPKFIISGQDASNLYKE